MSHYLLTGSTGGLGEALCAKLIQVNGIVDCFLTRDVWSTNSPIEVTQMIALRAQQSPYDGVIHCAGAELVKPLRLCGDGDYRSAMFAADSAFTLLRACARRGVVKDGGSIVLMSSVAAHRGTTGMAAYSAGKAAVEAMARCAALELAPRKIRVNCVAAGAFDSPMHSRVLAGMPETSRKAYAGVHPLGFGSVEAVTDAIGYLLCDLSRWVTGTTMAVDGGFTAA